MSAPSGPPALAAESKGPMFRANPRRGEDVPTVRRANPAVPASFEALLALSLCAIVILASMALLRRTGDYSRVMEELQADSMRLRPRRARTASAPTRTEPRPELVVLVSLDGLRADRLELYGHARATAPNLRALGENGVVFRTVAAQSSHPLVSHKSLLTGKYPTTLMLEVSGADLLDLARVRAPEAYLERTFTGVSGRLATGFLEHGYRTAAFTDGAWTDRARGFEPGFANFEDATGGLEASVTRALEWLDQKPGAPAFLFLQANALDCPYASGPTAGAFCADHAAHGPLEALCAHPQTTALTPAERAALADHYDAAVLAADAALGRLLEGLNARGLAERALLAVTSAHGESLGERDAVGHGGLHLEELLVPLVLHFPAAWNLPPAFVDEPAERVDVLPTLFALCGFESLDGLDGRSLVPTLLRGVRGRPYLVAQGLFAPGGGQRSSPALRTLLVPGRWQVIQDGERSEASFFALDDDPLGLVPHPIAPAEFAPLLDLLLRNERRDPRATLRHREPVHFEAALQAELEQLGYGAGALAGHGRPSDLR